MKQVCKMFCKMFGLIKERKEIHEMHERATTDIKMITTRLMIDDKLWANIQLSNKLDDLTRKR